MEWFSSPATRPRVKVDFGSPIGALEWWRHSFGHGGINARPIPTRVVENIRRLRPKLVRIFLQEFFRIYDETGRFNWDRLDPYMASFEAMGSKVVAAVTIKPKFLFPKIDQGIWRPSDIEIWQKLIYELVSRYSVQKPIVTHWEIGNETDIGEWGGCPYLIKDPNDYFEFYKITTFAIFRAFPNAKVGGPATCSVTNEPLPGLVKLCAQEGYRLDFISWHGYHDSPETHATSVQRARELLKDFPGRPPELFVTEWNKGFDRISIEEMAFDPRRAAKVASIIFALMEAKLDWSFYYHIWDQTFYWSDFEPFFSEIGMQNMHEHWNELPHRFGLFGVDERVRPQYFVYQMLCQLGEERVTALVDDPDIRVVAGKTDRSHSVMIVNDNAFAPRDAIVRAELAGLDRGTRRLRVYRIDHTKLWDEKNCVLIPSEHREVDVRDRFRCQVYVPAGSVVMLQLTQS